MTTRVAVTPTAGAGALEKFAASELQRYVQTLFGITAEVNAVPAADDWRFGLAVDDSLDEQALALQRTGEQSLRVAGGSPAALLWAVYELVERWGVTYLLHGDVFPDDPGPLRLPDADVRMSPRLRTRGWRTISTHAFGPESWSLADYRRFVDQWAKMKINHLHFSFWPWQPFVDYTFRRQRKSSAYTKPNQRLPLTDDMIGGHLFGRHFGPGDEFENPELRGLTRYEDRVAAGQRLVRAIMEHARARGMTCSVLAQVTEWPKEFQHFFPGSTEIRQAGSLTFGRAIGQSPDDPAMVELARAALRGHFEAYPDVDVVYLGAQEHRDQTDGYERCFQALDAAYDLSAIRPLDETLRLAARRTKVVGGGADREVARVKGDLISLYFLDRVLSDPSVLARGAPRPPVEVGYGDFADEVVCYLGRLRPAPVATLDFVDYTAGKVLDQREVLDLIPTDPPANMIFTLADDNVGIMPQLTTTALHELSEEIIRRGWNGFVTRYWMIGDLDPTAACIARVAWDASASAAAITREQATRVCGAEAAPLLARAFGIVEQVTRDFDSHGIGFGFPVETLLMKHWDGKPLPEAFRVDREHYARALDLARQALDLTRPAGRAYVAYYVGRLSLAVHYIDCVDLVHRASVLGTGERSIRLAREALDALRQAIEAWAAVARDGSDLGAIACLNELAFRRLARHLTSLEEREIAAVAATGIT